MNTSSHIAQLVPWRKGTSLTFNSPLTTCKLTSASGMVMAASDAGLQEYLPPSEGRTDSIVSTEEYWCPTADFPTLNRDLGVDLDPESCGNKLKVQWIHSSVPKIYTVWHPVGHIFYSARAQDGPHEMERN